MKETHCERQRARDGREAEKRKRKEKRENNRVRKRE